MKLKLKVIPGAKKTEITGWHGDALKIRVSAPPDKGRANRAVIETLADALGVACSQIEILSGSTSQRKTIEISDFDEESLLKAFSKQ